MKLNRVYTDMYCQNTTFSKEFLAYESSKRGRSITRRTQVPTHYDFRSLLSMRVHVFNGILSFKAIFFLYEHIFSTYR